MENLKLIQKVAYKFHRATGLELDELIQEGCLAYCEAIDKYDETKGALSTFIWNVVRNKLTDYCRNEYWRKKPLNDLQEIQYRTYNEYITDLLSIEATEIIKIIKTTPKPFLIRSQEDAIKRLVDVLKNNGWSMKRIWIGIHEIKTVFSK